MSRPFLLAAAAAALLTAACGSTPSAGTFQGIALKNLGEGKSVSLASCPTRRCLTVYVAPWCGYCRRGTPLIRELRKVLQSKGMDSRVVVGMDKEPALREYARDFGPDALLDTEQALDPGGVPHFFVSDGQGKVMRHIAGLPPDPTELLGWILH
ncbi:MAG: redoxin family protein [Elusimicrobia bacterium]|nr:redoxin family protein [Elusimicrobiota bacterium]